MKDTSWETDTGSSLLEVVLAAEKEGGLSRRRYGTLLTEPDVQVAAFVCVNAVIPVISGVIFFLLQETDLIRLAVRVWVHKQGLNTGGEPSRCLFAITIFPPVVPQIIKFYRDKGEGPLFYVFASPTVNSELGRHRNNRYPRLSLAMRKGQNPGSCDSPETGTYVHR